MLSVGCAGEAVDNSFQSLHCSSCNTALQAIRPADRNLAVHAHVLADNTKVLPAGLAGPGAVSEGILQDEQQILSVIGLLFILQR